MAPRTRKRFIRYGGEQIGSTDTATVFAPAYVGSQSCTDETHPGPPYRSGGPLAVSKLFNIDLHRTAAVYIADSSHWYKGYFVVIPYTPPVIPSAMSLTGWGAKGWNRTFPLHPVYSLGVSIAEAKDIPRTFSQTYRAFGDLVKRGFSLSATRRTFGDFISDLKRGPKYIADHYLNTQFGWVPFFQDLAAVMNYRENLMKKLLWLRRNNGRSVRRRVTLDAGGFTENVNRNVNLITTMAPVLANAGWYSANATQNLPVIKSYDRKIWYVAKYRFYMPELAAGKSFDLNSHKRLATTLYGLDLDPSIIYRVIPWAWLLDWFLNIGTVIQNLYFRARFAVVAQYAYVMCSERFTYKAPGHISIHTGLRRLVNGSLVWGGPDKVLDGVSTTTYLFRQREEANPYGFGVTFASLSAYQWSILAALGLSRRSKTSAPRT